MRLKIEAKVNEFKAKAAGEEAKDPVVTITVSASVEPTQVGLIASMLGQPVVLTVESKQMAFEDLQDDSKDEPVIATLSARRGSER